MKNINSYIYNDEYNNIKLIIECRTIGEEVLGTYFMEYYLMKMHSQYQIIDEKIIEDPFEYFHIISINPEIKLKKLSRDEFIEFIEKITNYKDYFNYDDKNNSGNILFKGHTK